MTIWINLSCWNPFNTFTTIFTRKRKYAIDDSVDNEISTKRRNKRRQQLWITLKKQFVSMCLCSCSISIFILFNWSGCDAYSAEVPLSRNSVARKEDFTSTGERSFAYSAAPVEKKNRCPIAFHDIGGRCYFYGYFKLNWFRAIEFCHSFGESVSLACIESQDENEQLKKWLLRNGDHTTGVWVGGSDNGHIGKWAWFPTGQLIREFNWGPSQPSGGDQHCMYIVGGYLGYQWADFHCGFEMTFLCEYKVNDHEAWRRRRQMKNSGEFSENDRKVKTQYHHRNLENNHLHSNEILNQRINYTLTNWLHNVQHENVDKSTSNTLSTSREELNSKFKGESFILKNNQNINNYLMQEMKNVKKSVVITTKRPNKNSVIISSYHKNNRPDRYPYYSSNNILMAHEDNFEQVPILTNGNDSANSSNSGTSTIGSGLSVEQTLTTTTTATTVTTKMNLHSTTATSKPSNDDWSIFKFLKNVIKMG